MATFDESPTVCQGQPWAHWAERIGFRNDKDVDKRDDGSVEKQEGDTMKLRKEDMSLFGFCPARDDFYLVVCEICRQVVKPQALKSHIELRHGGVTPPKSEKMERQNKSVSSSQDINQLSPSKQQRSAPPSFTSSPKHSTSSSSSTTTTSTKSHSKHESKSRRNHSLAPVVRVERMSPSTMLKKSSSGLVNNMKMGGINSNLLLADKRELPSPQQPPPITPAISNLPTQVVSKKGSVTAGGEPRPKPNTVKASSKSKVPKERKLLLCKDRVYDPNKHCGVWISEIGKQCTRSLTCKTHSLALRRSVLGRKKNFDELLADHRAAKEALLKATQASKEAMQGNLSNSNATNSSTAKSVANKLGQSSSISQKVMPSPVKPKSSSKASSATSFRASNISGVGNTLNKDGLHSNNDVPGDRTDEKSNAAIKNKNVESSLYVTHHPRPAAMCTFGSRHMGLGFYVFNRNMDHVRTVLRTAFLDRSSHPPPSKKLCVESKLPPVPDFSSDPSDPYNFSWGEQQNSNSAATPNRSVTNIGGGGNLPESSGSIPSSIATASASALKNCQTKSNKVKSVSKTPKDVNTVNRTNTNNVKRKRTNASTCASTVVSSGNVVVSADLVTTTLPITGQVQRNSTMAIAKQQSSVDTSRMRNNTKLQTTLPTVPTIKNHSYSPSNVNNAFRDLNIVVTSLDVANGQLPANSGTAVLSRSLSGFHTITNVTAGGVPISPGLNIASTTVAAVQQHIERNANKKNKNTSGKGAKSTANQESNRSANVINPYLPGIITSGGVLVEGLHNTVSLPVVNNVAVGNSISPQTQLTTSTASPLFRSVSGSASPQIPTSSPLANGLGPSPPPPSTIHSKIVNHLLQGTTSAVGSPGGKLSSPGVDMATGNLHTKGKNSASKYNACSPKGSTPSTCKSSVSPLLAGSAQLAINRTGSVPTRSAKSTPVAVSGITFQQVYANQVLGTTPIGIQLPSKSGTIRTLPAGTPPSFTMRTPLPLNILTTAVPTNVTSDAESPGQPQPHPSFLLQTEDLRHPEVQGSPSLHT